MLWFDAVSQPITADPPKRPDTRQLPTSVSYPSSVGCYISKTKQDRLTVTMEHSSWWHRWFCWYLFCWEIFWFQI